MHTHGTRKLLDLLHAFQTPGPGEPRMLMKKIAVVLGLVCVDFSTELNVALRFPQVLVEPGQPTGVIPI